MTLLVKIGKAEARKRYDAGLSIAAAGERGWFDVPREGTANITRESMGGWTFDYLADSSCRGGVKAWARELEVTR